MRAPSFPRNIHWPAHVHGAGGFTRADWTLETLHKYIDALQEYSHMPVDLGRAPWQAEYAQCPRVDFNEVRILEREYERLHRLARAFEGALKLAEMALALAENREMARLDILGHIKVVKGEDL